MNINYPTSFMDENWIYYLIQFLLRAEMIVNSAELASNDVLFQKSVPNQSRIDLFFSIVGFFSFGKRNNKK